MPIFLSISVLFVLALLIWLLQDLWQGRAHRQRHQAWAVEAAAWNGRAQRWSQFAQALQAGEVGGPLVPPPLPAEPPAPPIPGPGSGAQVPLAVIITALTGLVGAGGKIYLDSQAKALAAKTAVADSLLKQVQEWQSLETELFQYDLASWGRVRDHVAPPPGPGFVVTNPPHGVRLSRGSDLRNLYAKLGQMLRARCTGWRVALLCPGPRLWSASGLLLEPRLRLLHGGVRLMLVTGVVPAGA